MSRRRRSDRDVPSEHAPLLKACRRAQSLLAVAEEGAWSINTDAACELLCACTAVQRAIDALRGELAPTEENPTGKSRPS